MAVPNQLDDAGRLEANRTGADFYCPLAALSREPVARQSQLRHGFRYYWQDGEPRLADHPTRKAFECVRQRRQAYDD